MRIRFFFFKFAFLFLFTSLSYSFDEKSAKKVFESRCSICHPLEWTLERKKTKEGWRDTVERMRRKTAGNVISKEDADIIVEYLFRIRGK
jgi:RNA-splicing ligase RtcB